MNFKTGNRQEKTPDSDILFYVLFFFFLIQFYSSQMMNLCWALYSHTCIRVVILSQEHCYAHLYFETAVITHSLGFVYPFVKTNHWSINTPYWSYLVMDVLGCFPCSVIGNCPAQAKSSCRRMSEFHVLISQIYLKQGKSVGFICSVCIYDKAIV